MKIFLVAALFSVAVPSFAQFVDRRAPAAPIVTATPCHLCGERGGRIPRSTEPLHRAPMPTMAPTHGYGRAPVHSAPSAQFGQPMMRVRR